MGFYEDWGRAQGNAEKEGAFLREFLDCSPASLETLVQGDQQAVVGAIKLLLSVPVSRFLGVIRQAYPFTTGDIFQYSKLEDATETLCTILAYEEDQLSFEEAGRHLVHARQRYACVKYGENHAKAAASLSLVEILKRPDGCCVVQISSLGRVSTTLSSADRRELIKRLALGNPFLKTLIFKAKTAGGASYADTASAVISGQTIPRRKHNNEIIINLILEDDPLKERIRWP